MKYRNCVCRLILCQCNKKLEVRTRVLFVSRKSGSAAGSSAGSAAGSAGSAGTASSATNGKSQIVSGRARLRTGSSIPQSKRIVLYFWERLEGKQNCCWERDCNPSSPSPPSSPCGRDPAGQCEIRI